MTVTMVTYALKDQRDLSLMIRSLELFALLVASAPKALLKSIGATMDTLMCSLVDKAWLIVKSVGQVISAKVS